MTLAVMATLMNGKKVTEGIQKVLPGPVLAFCCSRCSPFYLKNSAAAANWKTTAESDPARTQDHLLLLLVAALPPSRLRRSFGADAGAVARGKCNACYSRELRAR